MGASIPADRGRVLMEITGEQINTLSAGYVVHSRGLGSAARGPRAAQPADIAG